jgi:predicted nucleic acid-binding protein
MTRGLLADTGPLYAALDQGDRHHQRAHAELDIISKDRLEVFVAFPTLFEAYSLILHKLGRGTAFQWLTEVRSGSTILIPTTDDYIAANETVLKFTDQSITLFDALVAVLSNRSKMPVWTYDHHFDVMRTRVRR